jgi:hypothetical protein
MKSWLAKFRISAALDAGKPLPESLRRAMAADPDLERFARRTQALGRALRNPPPSHPAPHEAIMRAVRAKAAARREQPRRASWAVWLAAPASVALLAVVCYWKVAPPPAPADGPSLAGAVQVLEMGETMSGAMPSAVMAPLTQEWARVDHDLQNTTQVLLASFP